MFKNVYNILKITKYNNKRIKDNDILLNFLRTISFRLLVDFFPCSNIQKEKIEDGLPKILRCACGR